MKKSIKTLFRLARYFWRDCLIWLWLKPLAYIFGINKVAAYLKCCPDQAMTSKVLKAFGAEIANTRVRIGPYIYIHEADNDFSNLVVGNDVYIGPNVFLDLSAKIIFRGHCAIGANCQIFTHINLVGAFNQIIKPKKRDVVFEQHSGVNPGSIIHNSVIIKKYSYVNSGSVVLNDTASFNVYRGNPAESIAKIPESIVIIAEKKYLKLIGADHD